MLKKIKSDGKVLLGVALYNKAKDTIKDTILKKKDKKAKDNEYTELLIAALIYFYFSKTKQFGEQISLAVRLEALGDIIQFLGERIPFVGGMFKKNVSPAIEGFNNEDVEVIEALRDSDEVEYLEGYDPETDTFTIEGNKTDNEIHVITAL